MTGIVVNDLEGNTALICSSRDCNVEHEGRVAQLFVAAEVIIDCSATACGGKTAVQNAV